MANVLFLNDIIPYPPHYSGNSIRLFPLSRQIAERHHCFLAAFGQKDHRYEELKKTGVYEEILLLPPFEGRRSYQRFFSLKNGHLARVATPEYYRQLMNILNTYVEKHRIDITIAEGLMEYAEAIQGGAKIMDLVDCLTLALERKYEYFKKSMHWFERFKKRLVLARVLHQESQLTSKFDFITTASPSDRDALRKINDRLQERIINIPNGVSPEFLSWICKGKEMDNALAFWGALDFPPNASAIQFFYYEVFIKHLQDKDIRWFIIGRNPTDEMTEMSRKHPNIVVTGFVDNLPELVSQIPIMINPMQIGSGIKNKVLEAFALERLVISNSLGMEAISAKDGEHYINAKEPAHFASLILQYLGAPEERARIAKNAKRLVLEKYNWNVIGEKYLDLIERALSSRRSSQRKHS